MYMLLDAMVEGSVIGKRLFLCELTFERLKRDFDLRKTLKYIGLEGMVINSIG